MHREKLDIYLFLGMFYHLQVHFNNLGIPNCIKICQSDMKNNLNYGWDL